MLLTNRTKTGVQKQACKIVVMNETGTGDTNQFYYTYKYTYDADGKRISAVTAGLLPATFIMIIQLLLTN
jgi:hypothetical protein